MVEPRTVNAVVAGSSPAIRTILYFMSTPVRLMSLLEVFMKGI